MADAITTESIVRAVPSFVVRYRAMTLTEPVSSMSLPNKPPRRNIGNHCETNRAAPVM
jgi:hypothetical protein